MQITTATRTVEIYANTEAGITYRNVKDGKVTGPVRSADRATAKAGSVGREILDAIDAQVAAEAEVTETETVEITAEVATETVEITEGTEIEVAGRKGRVTGVYLGRQGRSWVAVTWATAEDGTARPSYGFAWLDQVTGAAYAPGSRAVARELDALATEWPEGVRVTGTDSEGRHRIGTVQRNGGGISRTGRDPGRTFVCVVWDADDVQGLRRRIEGPYTDSLARINLVADTIRRAVNLKW